MTMTPRAPVAFTLATCAALLVAALAGSATGLPVPPQDEPGSYAVIEGKKAPIPAVTMGDPATIARIIDEGKHHNQVMAHLTHLSVDIGPRLTGSSNAEAANRWARDQFESWGLTLPAFGGAKGQTSTDSGQRGLWQWGEIATRFDRGPSTGKVLAIRNPGAETPEYRTVRDMEFTTLA